MISVFIREPSFVGQTKDRLSTEEAARWVENAVRDHFDTWLAADPKSAGAILDFLVLRAEERLRRRQEKETQRKTATKKLRLPGKLVDCSATDRTGTELFIVEGDSAGGSAKGARDRTFQALLPLRGKVPERPWRGILEAWRQTPRSATSARHWASAWARSSASTTCAMTRSSS